MPATVAANLYDILGVSKEASQDEIRKAYLGLAKKYHPDKTGGDKAAEEKLKRINAAYDVLKNPEKRRQYDESLADPFMGEGGFDGFGGGQPFEGGFADIFADFFRQAGGQAARGPRRGRDVEVMLRVGLRDVVEGSKKTVTVPGAARCEACRGTGAEGGAGPEVCPNCKGAGQVSSGGKGLFISQTCPVCGGKGQVISVPCRACHGSGRRPENRTVVVTIPAGATTGTRLRLAGQGEPGEPGAPDGDLFIVLTVEADELFERDGQDVLLEVPVTFSQAALGDRVEVPTLRGKAQLRIPAGVQSGAVLRMRGQGLPAFGGKRKGDQLVRIQVEVPTRLSDEQREVIERLRALEGPTTSWWGRGFSNRARGATVVFVAAFLSLFSAVDCMLI